MQSEIFMTVQLHLFIDQNAQENIGLIAIGTCSMTNKLESKLKCQRASDNQHIRTHWNSITKQSDGQGTTIIDFLTLF